VVLSFGVVRQRSTHVQIVCPEVSRSDPQQVVIREEEALPAGGGHERHAIHGWEVGSIWLRGAIALHACGPWTTWQTIRLSKANMFATQIDLRKGFEKFCIFMLYYTEIMELHV
jgi:hypothetical protein